MSCQNSNARLTEAEYARQEMELGKRGHFANGTWWQQAAPGYCKPIMPYKRVRPGASHPHRRHALLGYSHLVPDDCEANGRLTLMILRPERLLAFDLTSLPGKRRNLVRRAMKTLDATSAPSLVDELDRVLEINVSQAERQRGKTGYGLDPEYYIRERETWEAQQHRYLSFPGRVRFAVRHDDRLAAYSEFVHVEDVVIIGVIKAHTDYLGHKPVDLLYYLMLRHLAQREGWSFAVNGAPAHSDLDHMKTGYLFQPESFGVHSSAKHVRSLASTGVRLIRDWRTRLNRRRATAKLRR